jgi:hypothetical protein
MTDRYCRNCGQELAEDDRFCSNCGKPVHEAAYKPTPEVDVPIPPPPRQAWDTTSATPQPAQTADSSEFRLRGRANRRATFRTRQLSEGLHSFLTAS